MKEFISYTPLGIDTVNGHKLQITYTFSSFDQSEIDALKEWCHEHISAGLEIDGVMLSEDIQKTHHCSLWNEERQECTCCNHPCPDSYECPDFD